MSIGQKLLDLRKSMHLSQEEVADKLNVTRQTISKWETDQSTPDFDKIAPLCELYGISSDELLMGKKINNNGNIKSKEYSNEKRAKGIASGILLYFVSLVWVMITIPVMEMNPIISSAIFLVICGMATFLIVYVCVTTKREKSKVKNQEPTLLKQIKIIISLVILVIYLFVSFTTMAWHLTWILWVVDCLLGEIVKLIFMLGSGKNEK